MNTTQFSACDDLEESLLSWRGWLAGWKIRSRGYAVIRLANSLRTLTEALQDQKNALHAEIKDLEKKLCRIDGMTWEDSSNLFMERADKAEARVKELEGELGGEKKRVEEARELAQKLIASLSLASHSPDQSDLLSYFRRQGSCTIRPEITNVPFSG